MVNLRELDFFKSFPKGLIAQINKCAEIVTYAKGESVLVQGQTNQSLYFLIEGTLAVYVDGGKVAELNQKGDLVGEMSLISSDRVSATINADTDVKMYKIDANRLQNLKDKKGNKVDHSLYKIYSDVLVQKLEDTNQKAKHFEDLSADLQKAQDELIEINQHLEEKVKERTAQLQEQNIELEQKYTELTTSNEKLKELYSSRDKTFESLEKLLNENLIPLQKGINLLKSDDEEQNLSVLRAEQEIGKAIDKLSPLTEEYRAEKQMTAKRVLVADSIKNQRIVAKMALGGTGVELDIISTLEEGIEKINQQPYDIVLFDQELKELSILAKRKNPETKFVFVTSQDIPSYLPELLGHPFFPNVVSRDEEDRQFTIKNFVTTVSKLASNNIFGLEKYLSWGIEIPEHEIKASDERVDLIDQMRAYFKRSGMRSLNTDRCAQVAEELLMNAIYDAPHDSEGKPLYNHIDRTTRIELQPSHYGRFRYATDGMYLAVSVEDPFGALEIKTIFKYLESCYGGASLNDNDDQKAGGGRGLHQIIENSDLVVFNVDPGRRTEVIAFFNADVKQAGIRNPNLHFFKKEEAA